MSSSSFCIFWKKFYLILCLNVFGFSADFKSDGRLFHMHFCPAVVHTKTRNEPKPPTTTHNHPKPATTTHHHPSQNHCNQSKPPTTTQNHLQRSTKTYNHIIMTQKPSKILNISERGVSGIFPENKSLCK